MPALLAKGIFWGFALWLMFRERSGRPKLSYALWIPTLWGRLRGPERYQVGRVYAEMTAAGQRIAAAALKRALLEVHGFDFVPETLRSDTFSRAKRF